MESEERYGWGQSQGGNHRPDDINGNGSDSSVGGSGPKERSGKSVNCPDCGKEVKNLGAHKRFCKGEGIIIDDYMGKSLSFVLESIRQLLRSFSKTVIDTRLVEEDGQYQFLQLTIRIPIRR